MKVISEPFIHDFISGNQTMNLSSNSLQDPTYDDDLPAILPASTLESCTPKK